MTATPRRLETTPLATMTFNRFLLIIYLGGLVILVSRLLWSAIRLHRTARDAKPLTAPLDVLAVDVAHRVGLKQPPRLLTSSRVSMPLVFGVIRPTVLLPSDFDSWSVDERRATLLHEMTHVRRRDLLCHFVSLFNRCVYWFHPASWLLHRRLTESREWATDREVVEKAKEDLPAAAYAKSLLSVVARISRSDCRRGSGPALAMATRDDLEARLRLIIQPTRSVRARGRIRRLGVAMVMLAAVLTTVRLSVAPAQESTAKPPTRSASSPQPPDRSTDDDNATPMNRRASERFVHKRVTVTFGGESAARRRNRSRPESRRC